MSTVPNDLPPGHPLPDETTTPKDILTVIGKEWYDRTNSYCAVRIFWNGRRVAVAPFQYGYGDFYKQAAREALGDWFPPDIVVKDIDGMELPLWQIAQNGGFDLDAWLIEGQTRRMVEEWGTEDGE